MKSLSGPLLVRMIHTKDGAKVGAMCVKMGTAKVTSISAKKWHSTEIVSLAH